MVPQSSRFADQELRLLASRRVAGVVTGRPFSAGNEAGRAALSAKAFLELPISWRGTLAFLDDVGLTSLDFSRSREVDADLTAPSAEVYPNVRPLPGRADSFSRDHWVNSSSPAMSATSALA